MAAVVLDGKKLAADVRSDIARRTAALFAETGVQPGLGVILVGADPASQSYVTAKERACVETGMFSLDVRMPAETTQDELIAKVQELNVDPRVHGILVQLPLPKHLNADEVIRAIVPEKDVDGFTPENVGRMMIGETCFIPCTPHGIIKMLLSAGVETAGKHAVVIGRSNIVGRPVSFLLSRKGPGGNATVTVCHTGTPDAGIFTRQADIVVVATGVPHTLTGDMVKPGAVVIDVGVNRVPDATNPRGYRLCGDADYDSVAAVAGAITPVPGGVGPMTITMLLENTLVSAQRFAAKSGVVAP